MVHLHREAAKNKSAYKADATLSAISCGPFKLNYEEGYNMQ